MSARDSLCARGVAGNGNGNGNGVGDAHRTHTQSTRTNHTHKAHTHNLCEGVRTLHMHLVESARIHAVAVDVVGASLFIASPTWTPGRGRFSQIAVLRCGARHDHIIDGKCR